MNKINLIGNIIALRITNVSKISQQNNSEMVKNENDKVIPKEKYVSPEERLIYKYNNGILKKNKFNR